MSMSCFLILLSTLLVLLTDTTAVSIGNLNIGLEERYNVARVPAIIQALRSDQQGITCLTEVWGGPDMIDRFVNELSDIYPYHARYEGDPASASDGSPCDFDLLDEADDILQCFLDHRSVLALASCIYQAQVEQNSDCWSCILEQGYAVYSQEKDLTEALGYCYFTKRRWTQTLGLLVLSKYPVVNSTSHLYESFLAPRGLIDARIQTPVGEFHQNEVFQVICTHLTPNNDFLIYPPGITNYTSWDEENLGQAKELISYSNSTFTNEQIIVGDFNHSPDIPDSGITGEITESHDYFSLEFAKLGGADLTTYLKKCSACSDNTVLSMETNRILDYTYYRSTAVLSIPVINTLARLAWEYNVRVKHNYDCLTLKLSDHYGYVVFVNESMDIERSDPIINTCTNRFIWQFWLFGIFIIVFCFIGASWRYIFACVLKKVLIK